MRFHHKRQAFTLIELLVVVGIIVLLAGILLPVLYKTFRSANKTRLAADLNTIGVALDAYKSDFGDYPRVTTSGTGFAVLGKALVGPYDAGTINFVNPASTPYKAGTPYLNGGIQTVALRDTSSSPGSAPDWTESGGTPAAGFFSFADGADGPGFRVGPKTTDTNGDGVLDAVGKVHGPYLPADKFKRQGLALLDHFGNPIMYFPASPVKVNLNQPGAFYITSYDSNPSQLPNALIAGGGQAMYNFDDNGVLAMSLMPTPNASQALAKMQALMGVPLGQLAGGSGAGGQMTVTAGQTPPTPRTTAPFILWSAGPDGMFGPLEDISSMNGDSTRIDKLIRSCDDVANFSFTQ